MTDLMNHNPDRLVCLFVNLEVSVTDALGNPDQTLIGNIRSFGMR